MKMHSYMTINGYLQYISTRLQQTLEELHRATTAVGGWDEALVTAKAHREELDAMTASGSAGSETEWTPSITPAERSGTVTSSFTSASTANALRQRLIDISANPKISTPSVQVNSEFSDSPAESVDQSGSKPSPPSPHPLVDHPDAKISAIATDYTDMESELVGSGPNYVRWPNNITLKNFTVYQLIPTLVYELEYPRTDRYV